MNMKANRESGIALATTLVVLVLVVALVVGFSWMVMVDQSLGGTNGNEQLAFYGAEAGMEELTAQLGNLFTINSAPTGAEINALDTAANVPTIPGVEYLNPNDSLGYSITFPPDANGNPQATNHTILSGAYQGMTGLLTPYTLTVTSRTINAGSEVRLQRYVQTVSIPVFQFGMFSQTDLSFFAGPNFNFGGRVQTNGNLWLAEGDGSTLTFADKVTAAGEVIRDNLSNGWATSTNYTGTVQLPNSAGGCNAPPAATCIALTASPNQGSVNGAIGSWTPNEPTWTNLSEGTYNGYIEDGTTGAKALNLSITLNNGAQPIDLIRRSYANEDTSAPLVLAQRYYSMASVRILLSDNENDITELPCEDTSVAPINLATLATTEHASGNYSATGGVPIAMSGGGASYSTSNHYWTASGTPLIQGYLKVEIQTSYAVPPAPCGTWKDVTAEVLALGIAGPNQDPSTGYGTANYVDTYLPSLPTTQIGVSACANPSPNAILRFEHIRDNPSTGKNYDCGITSSGTPSTTATDYWPNALFDTREGNFRDICPTGGGSYGTNPCNDTEPTLGGVMDYVELDVGNLAKWLRGSIGSSGTQAKDPNISSNDFVVYFSDRRGNHTSAAVAGWPPASPSGNETGEYGFEDNINPSSGYGCPNGTLDNGETLDEVENSANQAVGGTPEDYGETSPYISGALTPALLSGVTSTALAANPHCAGPGGIWPGSVVVNGQEARENDTLFFRRALMIDDGATINLGTCPDTEPCGLSIVSENPAYIKGNYNYNAAGNGNFSSGTHVAAAIIADALTFLSSDWNDINSFATPYFSGSAGSSCPSGYTSPCGRNATTTNYRVAVVAGKGISFPQPSTCGGSSCYQDFGTDGGVHNFLRMLEDWNGQTLEYRGSIVSFFYNRQATGVYKDGLTNSVYSPPSRGYNFDTDFLTPALLPPRTPMFRDVNTVGFTQTILPSQ